MINKYMIGIKTKTTIYAPEDALKTMKKREASWTMLNLCLFNFTGLPGIFFSGTPELGSSSLHCSLFPLCESTDFQPWKWGQTHGCMGTNIYRYKYHFYVYMHIYIHTQVCVYTCIYCLRSLPSKWLKRTDYANVHLLYLCVYTRSCDFTLPKERYRYGPKQRCTNDKKTLQKLNPCQCWTVSTFFSKLQATHHLPAPISSPLPPATYHLPYSDHGPWSPILVLPAQ